MPPKFPLLMHLNENRNHDRAILEESDYTLVEMVVYRNPTTHAI